MKKFNALATASLSLFALVAAAVPASADYPGVHPFYRHALADLRYAHALIARPSYVPGVDGNEDIALDDIARAYGKIKAAGVDDGKPVDQPVPVDGGLDHRGRLNRALQVLGDARRDIDREEQNPDARFDRRVGSRDIAGAIRAVRHARFEQRTGL